MFVNKCVRFDKHFRQKRTQKNRKIPDIYSFKLVRRLLIIDSFLFFVDDDDEVIHTV